ncbi:ABC transporter substrate-binding protein [Nocardia sp. NPDC059239]|uniref:ABC transporter substrate-binding protein n=1 Tax=Nocardia sp. NPDC059239 TaxID=3346785 RepID=UPI00369A9E52
MFHSSSGLRRRAPAVIGLALVALVASACGSTGTSGSKATSLTMLAIGTPQYAKSYDQALASFTAQTGITVDVQGTGVATFDDVSQRLTNSITAGNTPDIAIVGNNDLERFAAAGVAQPLDSLMAADRQFVDSNFDEDVLEADKVKGKQVAIPYLMSTTQLFYNKDAFAKAGLDPNKPPQTFSELKAAAQALVQSKAVKTGVNYDSVGSSGNANFLVYLLSAGGSMMDPDKKTVTFNSSQARDVLTFWRDMVSSGLADAGKVKDHIDAFTRGDQGMEIVGNGAVANIKDVAKFSVGKAPMPVPDGGSLTMPIFGASVIVVTKDPARQASAWKVIKALTGPEGSTVLFKNIGYTPVSKLATAGSQYLAPLLAADPLSQVGPQDRGKIVPWFQFPGRNATEINDNLGSQIVAILRGDTSPADGLAKAADQAKGLLQ